MRDVISAEDGWSPVGGGWPLVVSCDGGGEAEVEARWAIMVVAWRFAGLADESSTESMRVLNLVLLRSRADWASSCCSLV